MNNQEQSTKTDDMFCIDDLMLELRDYARQELQKIGKPHIEAETYPYSDGETCWIAADRNRLRQIFVILLDDAVKNIDSGFIVFGYFVQSKLDGIDIFVDDTRLTEMPGHDDVNLSIAQGLAAQTGSHIQVEPEGSYSFSVKGFTKLVKT